MNAESDCTWLDHERGNQGRIDYLCRMPNGLRRIRRFGALHVLSITAVVSIMVPHIAFAQGQYENMMANLAVTTSSKPPAGIHTIQGKCGNGRTMGQIEIDGNGNGWQKGWDCNTGSETSEANFTNWLPNGKYIAPFYGVASGQFKNGVIDGTWQFTPPSTAADSITFVNGSGLWHIPNSICPGTGAREEGRLVNGLEEGLWASITCIGHKQYVGAYLSGKKTGVWHYYDGTGNVYVVQNYENGEASGSFVFHCPNHLRIEGESKGGYLISFAQSGFFQGDGKIWGTWKFYGADGELLGQDVLSNGTRHFVGWQYDGLKLYEGDIADGLPDGIWSYYDWAGRLDHQQKYNKGQPVP